MDIDDLIDGLIGREGGYVDHTADKGGPTRWGVTEAVARAHGYSGDMRTFPRAQAAAIYGRLYWLRPGFDRVAEHAPKVAVAVRGEAGEAVLVKALDALQGERYVQLAEARPANEAFLYGWPAGRVS